MASTDGHVAEPPRIDVAAIGPEPNENSPVMQAAHSGATLMGDSSFFLLLAALIA